MQIGHVPSMVSQHFRKLNLMQQDKGDAQSTKIAAGARLPQLVISGAWVGLGCARGGLAPMNSPRLSARNAVAYSGIHNE